MTSRPGPRWVSLEGVNGVGKTHLAAMAIAVLGGRCVSVAELPDADPDSLPGRVIAALARAGDLFLRGGTPVTETLLLAALQVHRHEATAPVAAGRVVLEDRGPLSVAVYQSAILEPADDAAALRVAHQILAAITAWRPPPRVTVLLRDDPQRCLERFAHRIGRPIRPDEHRLIRRADGLYARLARQIPGLTVIDRRDTTTGTAVRRIAQLCRADPRRLEHPTEPHATANHTTTTGRTPG